MRRPLLLGSLLITLTSCGSLDAPPSTGEATPPGASLQTAHPVPPTSQAKTTSASSTAPPPSLQSAFEEVKSGVTRFEVATCEGNSTGSGFQVSPSLVATVAHVVHEGQVIRVIQGTMSTAGTVIGIDQGTDVALVRTAVPMKGYVFSFSDTEPRVGDQVAALGFPRGNPLAFTPGTINGLDRKATIEGFPRHDLLELDAATHPGSSGGPVIRPDGSVVGLVDAHRVDPETGESEQGRRLAVSSAMAQPLIDEWRARTWSAPPPDCRAATSEDGTPVPEHRFPHRENVQAGRTLDLYFRGINDGDFATALAQLAAPLSLDEFRADVASTVNTDIDYRTFETVGDQRIVWVTFTSHQSPGKGPMGRPQETCTNWSLDYVLTQKNGLWLIDQSRPHEGAGHVPCAPIETGTPTADRESAQPSATVVPSSPTVGTRSAAPSGTAAGTS